MTRSALPKTLAFLILFLFQASFLSCQAPQPVDSETLAEREAFKKRLGQLVMIGFHGKTPAESSEIIRTIKEFNLGGVFLFARNVSSQSQLAGLVQALKAASPNRLLVATDQEGGLVSRLNEGNGFASYPSPANMGRGSTAQTKAVATRMAAALRSTGINLNLGPVVDVNVNSGSPAIGALGRSFSPDEKQVANHAKAFIEGHHDQGVLTTLKHFPGHGSATGDSHDGFTNISDTYQRDRELYPYKALIGAKAVDAIMTAHVFHSEIDPERPATLSRTFIHEILRGELKYKGLVLSDSMSMGAIRKHYSNAQAIVYALGAGVDILSYSFDPKEIGQGVSVYETVQDIVRIIDINLYDKEGKKRALYTKVEAALKRIEEFKKKVRS